MRAPGIVMRLLDYPCPNWIEVQIPHGGQQILAILDYWRSGAVEKNMSSAFESFVDQLGQAREHTVHKLGQLIGGHTLCNQMQV